MTLLAEIQALPNAAALLAAGNFHSIAAAVSAGRIKVISKEGGIGLIMNTLGPVGGAQLLEGFEVAAVTDLTVKWGLKLILAGTLDFGLPSTRAMIDTLVPEPARSALKAVAEVPDPVGWEACRTAVQGA